MSGAAEDTGKGAGKDARRPAAAQLRAWWSGEDWQSLVRVEIDRFAHAPAAQRRAAAVLVAGAQLQLGDLEMARAAMQRALDWGSTRGDLARALLPAVELSLARAASAIGDGERAESHLKRDAPDAGDPAWLAQRAARLSEETRAALAAAAQPRVPKPAADAKTAAWKAPAWIAKLVDECLADADVHDHADRLCDHVLLRPDDRLQFSLLMSDRFKAKKDNATALHFLGSVQPIAHLAQPPLIAELARRFAGLGRADTALDIAVGQWLGDERAPPLDPALARQLVAQHRRQRDQQQAQSQHGHHVLLGYLEAHVDDIKARAKARGKPLTLIEIGTTREAIPGQGSTRQLAAFCFEHGLNFVTVDMDPHNGHMARETFAALGAPFEAVTMKGEDYLRAFPEPIDLVFLDAYDFDHGKHSELRQSRYERYLGARIDDKQCHEMHVDCAHTLVAKLAPDGVICFDDTWLEDGRWIAKGTLAMPYLLEHGFRLMEARNHAAMLARSGDAAEAAR